MKWICDPGHGWLEVPLADIERLGIRGQISPYSYLKGKTAYLEEDLDAWVYIRAAGIEPPSACVNLNTDAPCRSYPSFR